MERPKPHHNTTHGMTRTRIYKIWGSMKERCLNPGHHAYARYGGRGIVVCDRWLAFEGFFEDMGFPPAGQTLDRIDNNKGYSPSNCKWSTLKEQQSNTRLAHILEFDGLSLTISEWARRLKVSRNRIRSRLQRGLSVEDALTLPKISRWEKK